MVAKGDVMLVVRQVQEVWKANKEELKQWLFKIKGLVKRFTKFEIWHVRREDNRRTHELVETQGEEGVVAMVQFEEPQYRGRESLHRIETWLVTG